MNVKITVDNETYNKLIRGESIEVVVDSVRKPLIAAKLTFKETKKCGLRGNIHIDEMHEISAELTPEFIEATSAKIKG